MSIIITRIIIINWFFFSGVSFAHFSFEKSSDSLSFAQMYLGLDFSSVIGGATSQGDFDQKNRFAVPRFNIGATHFWGFVDFYVSIPLGRVNLNDIEQESDSGNLSEFVFNIGTETGMRLYLLPIKDGRLSPFFGASWNAMHYKEEGPSGTGANHIIYRYPLQLGLAYSMYPFVFELGGSRIDRRSIWYYTSPTERASINLPERNYWASVKGHFETTKSVSKGSANKLGSPYIGVGPSSAWNNDVGSYEKNDRPFINYTKSTGRMAELSVGFEVEYTGTLFNIAYRNISYTEEAYDYEIEYTRKSTAFEVMQIFANFHGFQPFVGPSYSQEELELKETLPDQSTTSETGNKNLLGLVYGWDIRPTEYSWWYLRTTLRYYPKVALELASGSEARFVNNEFNFIQFVFLPFYL